MLIVSVSLTALVFWLRNYLSALHTEKSKFKMSVALIPGFSVLKTGFLFSVFNLLARTAARAETFINLLTKQVSGDIMTVR